MAPESARNRLGRVGLSVVSLIALLSAALIGGLASASYGSAVPDQVSALATHSHYYYQYMGPDYVGEGYMLKVKFKGTRVYITDFATDRCYTGTKIKKNNWRYRQPIASDTGEWVTGRARTNSSHTWFKMYDQYGDPRTFYETTRADANAWLYLWNESSGTNYTWSNPPC